jgi:hypothetical protein
MTRNPPSKSEKSRERDGSGPPDPNRRKGPGSRGTPGGPKGSTPDKHGGSGAGRQEGGSGAGRER